MKRVANTSKVLNSKGFHTSMLDMGSNKVQKTVFLKEKDTLHMTQTDIDPYSRKKLKLPYLKSLTKKKKGLRKLIKRMQSHKDNDFEMRTQMFMINKAMSIAGVPKVLYDGDIPWKVRQMPGNVNEKEAVKEQMNWDKNQLDVIKSALKRKELDQATYGMGPLHTWSFNSKRHLQEFQAKESAEYQKYLERKLGVEKGDYFMYTPEVGELWDLSSEEQIQNLLKDHPDLFPSESHLLTILEEEGLMSSRNIRALKKRQQISRFVSKISSTQQALKKKKLKFKSLRQQRLQTYREELQAGIDLKLKYKNVDTSVNSDQKTVVKSKSAQERNWVRQKTAKLKKRWNLRGKIRKVTSMQQLNEKIDHLSSIQKEKKLQSQIKKLKTYKGFDRVPIPELSEGSVGSFITLQGTEVRKYFPHSDSFLPIHRQWSQTRNRSILVRQPMIDVLDQIHRTALHRFAPEDSETNPGTIFTGVKSGGKSTCLLASVAYARNLQMLVFYIPNGFQWCRGQYYVEPNALLPGYFDSPILTMKFLEGFIATNRVLLKTMKLQRTPTLPNSKPLESLYDLGVYAMEQKLTGVGTIFKLLMDELRANKEVPMLFAVDGYNHLMCDTDFKWGDLLKFTDVVPKQIHSSELVIVREINRMLSEKDRNKLFLFAESRSTESREKISLEQYPLEPLDIPRYNIDELEGILDYYHSRDLIDYPAEQYLKEIAFLSAAVPGRVFEEIGETY